MVSENRELGRHIKPVAWRSFQAAVLLKKMRIKEDPHHAIIVDEYGGTTGLVTMEDIIGEAGGKILTNTMPSRYER